MLKPTYRWAFGLHCISLESACAICRDRGKWLAPVIGNREPVASPIAPRHGNG